MGGRKILRPLQHWLFGDVSFSLSEEYQGFRYRLLVVLIFVGMFFSMLFVLGEYTKLNRMQNPHLVTMQVYIVASALAWWLLRGRKHWYRPIAWIYVCLSLSLFSSALWLIPDDELRVMWFFVSVPGVFVLLGPRGGWAIVVFTAAILIFGNDRMAMPYSQNALATGIASVCYLGIFFHAFAARSVSYFLRMREYNTQLEHWALHDALTGVFNTRAYYSRCQEYIDLARRSGLPFAVLFVDLDHFKKINDQYGHEAGDTILKTVAHVLSDTIRRTDVLGRIGGEEFSVFLPNTPLDGAVQLAQVLCAAIEHSQPDIGVQRLQITASIGVAICDNDHQDIATIQRQADQAMYVAKSQGRNRVSIFEGPMVSAKSANQP